MGIMYKLMKHRNLTMDLSKPNVNTNTIKSDRNRLITIEGNIIDTTDATDTTSIQATEEVLNNNKNMDSTMDKQFTAEHIIQLCKFLAEKSKRNVIFNLYLKKNLYKQQQSPKKLTKSKQSQFQFQQIEYDDVNDEVEDFYQNEALPLLSKQRLEQQQRNHDNDEDDDENSEDDEFEQHKTSAVLSTRLSPDINSLNISSNTTTSATSCALQHQQQQQQIFNYQHHHHQQQQQQQQHHHQQQIPQSQGKRDILLKIRRQIFERKRLRENGAFEPQALNNSQVWRPW
ncbi:myb-like protein Q [Calliphora vicina]|uniref:myb-like protein Q n=1 Tax=Calliphora vicina TaxID=7373 RepID=UPI00325AAB47